MVLHDYDFVPGAAELNDRGRDRVLRIAALLPYNRFPVVVERLPHAPGLAEERRLTVLAAARRGRRPASARAGRRRPVAVSAPLQGPEAERMYYNLLQLTESAGTVPGTGVRDGATTGVRRVGRSGPGRAGRDRRGAMMARDAGGGRRDRGGPRPPGGVPRRAPRGPRPGRPGPAERGTSLSDPQVADVQVALARTVEGRGDVRQAAAFYTEAVRKDPTRQQDERNEVRQEQGATYCLIELAAAPD